MEENKIKFYDENEIKKIIENNEILYYADDGIDEVILKEEDIPDYIIVRNENEKYDVDLKFYKVGADTMNPALTTIGPFLDKADLTLRGKIIERLVSLQKNEKEPNDFKVIIEDMYEKVKTDIELSDESNKETDDEVLKEYEDYNNFKKYENEKAIFNTKIVKDIKHNGEIVEVLGKLEGRDTYTDRYVVRFNDGTIEDNVMNIELDFKLNNIKDPVQESMDNILKKIVDVYKLNDKEIEELKIATINYDYEVNDGIVFTRVESIENLFTKEDNETRINPSLKQLKAMAEFIKETEQYYILYGYEEYTEKVIDLILNKDESDITRLEFLNEIKDMVNHNIICYSEDYSLEKAKVGYEKEYARENKKLILIEQMIKEEKQKDKQKNQSKEAR